MWRMFPPCGDCGRKARRWRKLAVWFERRFRGTSRASLRVGNLFPKIDLGPNKSKKSWKWLCLPECAFPS
jgi:hypothetical protein